MGTSVVGKLDSQQTSALPSLRDAMAGVGAQGSTTAFNFFAAFDGTNNDRNNLALSGDPYPTNIADLQKLAKQTESDSFKTEYYPGVGTGEDRGGTINAGVAPNAPIQATALNAYYEFVGAAKSYIDAGGSYEDISASVAGFSRGGATAVKFAQLVNERGLVDAEGNVLAPPGSIPITGMALLDPVGRFVDGDLSIPSNVQGQVLVVQAENENRADFRPLDFSGDERVTTVQQAGNHVGIGGGYDQGGTAANVLEGVTGYFQNRGVAVADVPPEQRFDPTKETKIYTEAYQADAHGNVLTNEDGTPRYAWKVDDPAQGRQLDSPQHPPAQTEEQLAANSAALLSSLASIAHWSQMSDVQRAASFSAMYNTVDHMNNGELAGDLGGAASALSFVSALQHGNAGSVVVSGVSLANALGEDFASKEIASAIGFSGSAANVVPGLSLALAINSGNTMSMVAAAANFIPVYGPLISVGISLLGPSLFGDDDPPAPAGAAHFSWDANGHIQHTVDYSQSGGGEVANSVAANVQSMLEQVVAAANAKNPSTADDIAINPYCLPRVSFQAGAGGAMMEVTLSNGHVAGQQVDSPQFAEWLLKVVQETGGLAPAWQVQTEQVKWQQAHAQVEQLQAQRDALLTTAEVPTEDGVQTVQSVLPAQAEHYAQLQIQIEQAQERLTQLQTEFDKGLGIEAQSLQGHAIESADFKSQTFGALVVHLHDDAGVQAAQAQLTQVLRDIDGDGYFEKTQWVSATDAQGKQQGLLTLDVNGDGVIDTSDILNLGGNADHSPEGDAQLIPLTNATALATENADLQHNNIAWLDANGDGVIDKADPAFAAIKLWVDVNQDGKLEAGESQNLDALQIKSINFKTGEISYLDGSTDALTAATLTGDTEGIKLTQIQQADANGELHALNAGDVLEHEGYQGKVEVTDASGTHWIDQRNQTYEQQAKRTGDWEGTAEQEAHRHGGGNVEGAPTQTTATGATDFGPVKTQANVITQSTVEEGDARVVSDAPTQAPTLPPKANAQTTVAAGDSRVTSNAPAASASTAANAAASTANAAANPRIAFVPTTQTSVQSEIRTVTDNMIENSQSMLFGGGSASLGVLAAVGTGATASAASAAEVAQRVVSEVRSSDANTNSTAVTNPVSNNTFSTTAITPSNASADTSTPAVTFKQVDLGVLYVPPVAPASTPAAAQQNTATSTAPTNHDTPSTTFVQATVIVSAPAPVPVVTNKAAASTPATTTTPTPEATPDKATPSVAAAPTVSAAPSAPTLDYPVVQAETLPGTEDVVLRLNQSVLLANDSTPNASADPTQPALTITAVSAPLHGQVSLVDGEVLFAPDTNFHGTASFTYTVTDQYGLSSDGTATLVIAAVNDAPVTQGETATTTEDSAIMFTQAELLANDSDVDVATDGQVLRISAVSGATNGTVTMLANGDIRFVPSANYHGPVEFTYTVSDDNGGTTDTQVKLTLTAVNDAPVGVDDVFTAAEDTTTVLTAQQLLGNDTDNDIATDGDVLHVATVSNATNGQVRLLANGQIEFVPDNNFHGIATFDYVVSDSFGATSLSTVTLQVGAVNDAPVVVSETAPATEDTLYATTATALLGNDSDVDTATDGQVLSITQVQNAQHGVVGMDVNGRITFTPDANFHGTASFEYVVSDGMGADALRTGTVTLNVQAVNDAPVTLGETATTAEDTDIVLTQAQLLANDSDVDVATDGQVLSISAVSGATNGTVAMLANGDIRFRPNLNYHGPAEFTYTVSDGNGGTTDAKVNLTITAVNDAPVVQGEAVATNEDTPLLIAAATLLANDSDVDTATDGQVLSISAVSAIAGQTHGSVSLVTQADGTQQVQFTPDANYHGVATFNYTVSDGNGGFATAIATVNIAAVNDAPVTQGETAITAEDAAVVFTQAQLLANDSDVDVATDGQVLSISAVSGATNGTVAMLANGDIRFVPDANYHGPAEFTYTVSDGNGGTTDAKVNLTITAVNDAPVVQGEAVATNEDTPLLIAATTLLANDSDVDTATDGQVLSISAVSAIAGQTHGSVSLVTQADGTQQVQFKPDLNYHGTATFNYTVSDGNGGFATAIATVNIAAVNDAPVTQGESYVSDEDMGLIFTQAQLLANDSDVDVATDGQVLSISAVSGAVNGTVTMLANGDIRFRPNLNYHGPAEFTYTVSDGNGGTTDAKINLTITAVNDAPVVQGEAVATNEDTPLLIAATTLLANDSDVDTATDGQVLSISAVSAIAGQTHGSVSLVTQADGTQQVQFKPDLNYHGTATFNYTVSDGNGGFATAIATVNMAAVNDAPVTQGESYVSDEDMGLIFTQAQLLANDGDVDVATDGQVLSISRVGQAEHGTVWLDAQGNLRFVPEANYHGPAKFTYWVSDGAAADGAGAETPATMSLTIAAVNDIPVVQGESTDTTEDTTLLIDAATLLANDTDVDVATDNQVLSISAVSNATHCTVSLVTQADGKQHITFVPDANYHGTATFDYTVDDGNGGTAIATAVVNLSAVNDAPVTAGETATGDEDNTLIFASSDLLANDTDVDVATDNQVLSISRVGNATHGTVSLDAQGQVHFTPEANYHGSAQFTYWVSDGLAADGAGAETPATVTLMLLAVNDLPVVTGETVNTNEDTTLLFNPATLLANDTDVDVATDNQVLSITAVSNATHGTVVLVTQSDGSQQIRFTPEANYFGVASYQYTVSDGAGGNTVGTVVVNLAQVNDTPVAADDSLSGTPEDTALHISFASLLGNDTDADSLNAQWGGVDDVLTVSAVGSATHGTAAIVNGEVVFTPDANYHGAASFAYQVTDGSGAVSQALATFSVTAVNDAPVAVGETVALNEDTTLVISQAALLQNDSDVDTNTDGQVLSITAVSNAQHGTVTLNADGTISFVPEANYYGNASFDYTVSDGNGGATTTIATIALANVNDAPVVTGETVYGSEDQVLTITASALLQNDSDIDNARADLTISRVQSGTGGTVSLNASGNVVFTPTANYNYNSNGTATFTYWVKDPGGLESNAVTTTVVLAAVNDAPSAKSEAVTGASEDAVFNINKATLLANDHDIDDPDSALSLSWVGNATGGSVSLDASGNVVFTPTANFNGNATFQYKVRDAAGLESAVVQAVIPVAAVNDAPVAVDDRFTTYNNSTLTVAFNQLTSNDTDVEGDALTVSAVRDHANGHASIVNGQVQFVANAGFVGAASFDYLADDGHGGQTWATAFVDVKTPPNLYPTVEVTSTLFQGTNSGVIDIAYGAWHAVDDGNAGAVTFSVQQVIVSGGYYGSTWSAPAGATQYHFYSTYMYLDVRSWLAFTQLKTTWLLTDDRGLQNIWHFDYDIATGYRSYTDHMGYYSPPVILDLNGDGVHFTSLQNSNVKMDVNFDGIQDKMAWAGNDDGVLVWDKDHNHQISDTSEFAFQTLKADAQTDLEGLQALDTNGNGLLDAGDAKFAEFAVWQDANGNGVTDAGEFKTLTELGIASINLHSDGQMRDAGTLLANSGSGETDATVMGNAAFIRTDGSTGVVADTMLAYELGHATPVATPATTTEVPAPETPAAHTLIADATAADAQAAEIMRQALLFNQVCNTAVATDNTPLGFVPIEPDVQYHDMVVAPQDSSHLLVHSA